MSTLKSIVAVNSPAATAAGSFLRRPPSLAFGLWHKTQYCTLLREPPWMEKSLENSPWQVAQRWFSTTTRRASGAESSTVKVTTGFTAASVAVTDEVSCTLRRASAPKDHVPVASAGSAAVGVNSKAPSA